MQAFENNLYFLEFYKNLSSCFKERSSTMGLTLYIYIYGSPKLYDDMAPRRYISSFGVMLARAGFFSIHIHL